MFSPDNAVDLQLLAVELHAAGIGRQVFCL